MGFRNKSLAENFQRLINNSPNAKKYKLDEYINETLLDGWDMLKELEEVLGSDRLLEELIRFMDDDIAQEAARFIAQDHDIQLSGNMNESIEQYDSNPYKVFDDYMRDRVSVDMVIQVASRVGKEVATIEEVKSALHNSFIVGMKASELGISEDQVKSKLKELIKALEIY